MTSPHGLAVRRISILWGKGRVVNKDANTKLNGANGPGSYRVYGGFFRGKNFQGLDGRPQATALQILLVAKVQAYLQLWQTKGTEGPFTPVAWVSFPGEVSTKASSVPDWSTTSL